MLTGIFEINTATYENMIRFTAKSGGNLLVFGQAGIGKTEIPEQVAEQLGMDLVYWNLSTQEAPDLVGLPIISEENGAPVVKYASPQYMPIAERTPRPVMVLIDELDKAKPDLQNPLLEVLHSRTINGRKLNIGCIVATGNLPEENAFSKPVSHALTNRCQIFQLKSDFNAWQDWAANAGLNALVVGFLSRNTDYLSRKPIEGDPTAYARCSPRSWSKAAKELDVAEENKMTDIEFQSLIVAGRVGMEAATKFRVWLDHYRHIEPLIDALVKKGEVPNLNDMTVDRVLVLALGACSEIRKAGNLEVVHANGKKETEDERKARVQKITANIFKMIGHAKFPPEFQIAAVKSTLSVDLVQKFELTKVPDLMAAYTKVRKTLKS
jgi:hypothetical protein